MRELLGTIRERRRDAPGLRLDWRAYFRRFCELHGEPFEEGGRLLFPDGWTYSATDHKGPEWPPPEDGDERRRLLRSWWTLRLEEVQRQERESDELVRALASVQAGKSCQLQRAVRVQDGELPDGAARFVWGGEDVPYGDLLERLEWLRDERRRCEDKLKELGDGQA